MSDTEFHSGKLLKIEKPESVTFEEFCKQLSAKNGVTELDSYNDSWYDQLMCDFLTQSKYFIDKKNEMFYELVDHYKSEDSDSFMKLFNNSDGTISFVGSFYNGGTCLEEMLEEALEKHKSGS